MTLRPLPPRDSEEASGVESGLMADIAAGSQSAFAQLYDLTCAQIFGLILSVIPRRDAAEDVLQDCYLHVWARAVEFDARHGDVRAWISGIAHRRAVERTLSATAGTPVTPPSADGLHPGGTAAVA
ncbi:RNA polymerase sigma-70 factor (ECF subfamily) [Microbacterium foliorum]|uniref:sigma factor n=1 Tax=Microbacterium foliorum TaxID=104336 RepID=UPI0020A0901C|nr:sigma factor [Microbacterium foliorum]MCP1429110.1 RNA polymerase sigma-70 factor (ECF subfamily) [Microbacterium foliorum]